MDKNYNPWPGHWKSMLWSLKDGVQGVNNKISKTNFCEIYTTNRLICHYSSNKDDLPVAFMCNHLCLKIQSYIGLKNGKPQCAMELVVKWIALFKPDWQILDIWPYVVER